MITRRRSHGSTELGARHVNIGQGDVPWTVLADPEGNEFCILTPHKSLIE
jgi:Glyoxalase-like domain